MIRAACASALGALLLAGCANFAPTVPAGYTGPTALLRESGRMDGSTAGQLFYVQALDGKDVYSSRNKTLKENSGKGMYLGLSFVDHTVPAQPMHLTLVGRTITGAPVHEMTLRARGRFYEVTREVTFTPQPQGMYRIVGKLQAEGSDVWIEDMKTAQRVTP